MASGYNLKEEVLVSLKCVQGKMLLAGERGLVYVSGGLTLF
jgi:hypothetical protein